jgi:xylulokinase
VGGLNVSPRDDELILAIDIGLTNCKAVAFDLTGKIVRRVAVGYETHRPGPDRVEQDPDEWWGASVRAVRSLSRSSGGLLRRVSAIGVTAHMHAVAPIDAKLVPLGAAMILGDRRAAAEAAEITHEIGAHVVYEVTGTTMDASMPAAKIRWLAANDVDLHRRTTWFIACKDYVRARMTGVVATERVDACATSLYDIRNGSWSESIARAARAPLSKLPPILEPASIAGPLLPGPADELGLRSGTPVIVGAGDDVEVLGNGLLDAGACLEHLGTTGSILAVAPARTADPEMALELYPHTLEGLWVLGGSMTSAGAALEWAARSLGYRSIREAQACLAGWPCPPDAPVFIPHLEGARSPAPDAGARGAWVGLRPGVGRDGLMLAAFEGVALGLHSILARTEVLVGATGAVAVSAGGSADPRWLQVRADVYGRRLAVLETSEPTALGVFTLATAALRVDTTPADAVRRVVRLARTVEPDKATSSSRRREVFCEVDRALRGVWPIMAGAS